MRRRAATSENTAGPQPTLGELALSRALGAVRLLTNLRGSSAHRRAVLGSAVRRLREALEAVERELSRCA
jgi:hypothetical protein